MIRAYLVDSGGNMATMQLPPTATSSQINTFLAGESLAGVDRVILVEPQTITVTAPVDPSNVDKQVRCNLRLGSSQRTFSLLSPKESGEVIYRKGRVLTAAEKSLLLADWKTVNAISEAWIIKSNRFYQHR